MVCCTLHSTRGHKPKKRIQIMAHGVLHVAYHSGPQTKKEDTNYDACSVCHHTALATEKYYTNYDAWCAACNIAHSTLQRAQCRSCNIAQPHRIQHIAYSMFRGRTSHNIAPNMQLTTRNTQSTTCPSTWLKCRGPRPWTLHGQTLAQKT